MLSVEILIFFIACQQHLYSEVKVKMYRKGIVALALMVSVAVSAFAQEEQWYNFSNRNDVFGFGVEGHDIWSGTQSGLYKWHEEEGNENGVFEQYNDFIPTDMYVNCMLYDSDTGDRWFGVEGFGLVKYDGEDWARWDAEETGLPNNWIWDIAFDAYDNLWIAHSSGLSKFDGETFTNYTTEDGLLENYCYHVEVDAAGVVWIGGYSGLSSFSTTQNTFHTYTTENSSLPDSSINGITIDGYDKKWFATSKGLVSLLNSDWTVYTMWDDLPMSSIDALDVDQNNILWLAISGFGLIRYDTVSSQTISTGDGLLSNNIDGIQVGDDGTVWTSSGMGICGYNDGDWTYYRSVDGPVSNYVSKVVITPDDNVWFGTDSGITIYDGENWEHIVQDNRDANRVSDMAVDNSGNVWTATDAGIYVYPYDDTDNPTIYTMDNAPFPSNYLYCVDPGPDGSSWVGTSDGVKSLINGVWTTYNSSNGLVSDYVASVATDGLSVWCGSYSGVSRLDRIGGDVATFTTDNGLLSNAVYDIELNSNDGSYWLVSDSGLQRNSGGQWNNYTSAEGLPEDGITGIGFGPDSVWCGSWHSGATRIKNGETTTYNPENSGIGSGSVTDIEVAADGSVWFATNSGISLLCYVTVAPPEPPAPPTNVTATDADSDHGHMVAVKWMLSQDDDKLSNYWVYRSRNSEFSDNPVDISEFDSIEEIDEFEENGTLLLGSVPNGTDHFVDVTVPRNNVAYHFWVVAVASDGTAGKPVPATWGEVSVEAATPYSFALDGNHPNPFNAATTISFTLERSADATLAIYNLAGQKVRTFDMDNAAPGMHSMLWDGRADDGVTVSSGVYIARLVSGSMTASHRMLYVK